MAKPYDAQPHLSQALVDLAGSRLGTVQQAMRSLQTQASRIAVAAREGMAALEYEFRPSLLALGAALYAAAEHEYRRVHGRLPGSTRTARLRKKRRDEVMRWFSAQLASA